MKRENNLDFLRVLACILVISIHVSAFFVTKFVEEPNLKFTIGNFYDSFSRIAVPIFVLLSGRFALSDEKNINIKFYYKKIFFKIIIPTLIWSFLYFLYNYITQSLLTYKSMDSRCSILSFMVFIYEYRIISCCSFSHKNKK